MATTIHINKTSKTFDQTFRPGEAVIHASGQRIVRTRTGWTVRGFDAKTYAEALELV